MGLELEAIAAVVIGGTSLQGGKGSIVGTVIGALIVAVLTNGLRIIVGPAGVADRSSSACVILVAVYARHVAHAGGPETPDATETSPHHPRSVPHDTKE